ncbi:hypothetical protein KZJ38_07385 [Paraburkholderia edwinii]|uniref:Uncharacterized protein n=1 Tax=Paraburkholderia edwinii TaxID=2861782 RepID=A0ABX8UM91_9BURK|nr:hypothetical protein [Paraburkholderia edwinii]QYD70123.1 hypothetical protein KZJ38_07385 [Paraburkholderia edwinii]
MSAVFAGLDRGTEGVRPEYTGHGLNTGGLQAHSIGEEYPLITYMRGDFWRILDSRTGNTHELEYESAREAHADALTFHRVYGSESRIGKKGFFTHIKEQW